MSASSQKTIALFLFNLATGGVQWCMLRLARSLKSRGYNVVFVVVKLEGTLLPITQKEFEVVGLNATRTLTWKSVFSLYRFFKMRKPDVVISNMKRENLAAILACKITLLPIRLIVVEHTLSSFDPVIIRRWIKMVFEFISLALFYPFANEIVAVCRSIADDVERKMCFGNYGKINIIYNPVIPDNFESLILAKADHPWLQDTQKKVILGVARFHREKGFSLLIKAFADLHKRKEETRLILIGNGPEKPAYEALIGQLGLKDFVDMPGFRDNVFPWLAASKLFVLSSIWDEPFGLVIVEALACATPVVSTDGGGPSEILEGGRYGILIPRNNQQALTEAMMSSLDIQHDSEALKARGRSFSVERSADGYVNLLEKL